MAAPAAGPRIMGHSVAGPIKVLPGERIAHPL
jgi:hypothetical protein